MASARSLLLIADIGGYTDYMGSHRMSLAHAEVNTSRLLEKVIDAAPGFELIEIEGDAAFLACQADAGGGDGTVEKVLDAATAMHQAFHHERHYVVTNLCPCKSCTQADRLKLKFVAHVGEVATQTIRNRRKLVGIDVILVHRLLKNPVDVPEYVLLSEELYTTSGSQLPASVHEVSQDLEGIGPVQSFFVDMADLPAPAPVVPSPSLLERLGRTVVVAGSGMPQMLGLRRGRRAASVY